VHPRATTPFCLNVLDIASRKRYFTYEVVVRTANGLSGAAVSSNANDTNGIAGEPNLTGDTLHSDAQETKETGYRRAAGLGYSYNISTPCRRLSPTRLTLWTELQHWIGPVLHWLAGCTPPSVGCRVYRQ